uniref:Uncharacterized protein n=1 Tax=Rhodosorus marinus TaxID=101924 RepID=A0A7S2ZQA7_9RHOD
MTKRWLGNRHTRPQVTIASIPPSFYELINLQWTLPSSWPAYSRLFCSKRWLEFRLHSVHHTLHRESEVLLTPFVQTPEHVEYLKSNMTVFISKQKKGGLFLLHKGKDYRAEKP